MVNPILFDLNDSFTVLASIEPDADILMLDARSTTRQEHDERKIKIDNGVLTFKPTTGGRLICNFGSDDGEPIPAKELYGETQPLGESRLTTDKCLIREKNNTDVYNDPNAEGVPQEDLDNIHSTEYFDILWGKTVIQQGQNRFKKYSELGEIKKLIDLIKLKFSPEDFKSYYQHFVHARSMLKDKEVLFDNPNINLSIEGKHYLPYAMGSSFRDTVDVGIPITPFNNSLNGFEEQAGYLYKLAFINKSIVCK